jgi:hypothetical protein
MAGVALVVAAALASFWLEFGYVGGRAPYVRKRMQNLRDIYRSSMREAWVSGAGVQYRPERLPSSKAALCVAIPTIQRSTNGGLWVLVDRLLRGSQKARPERLAIRIVNADSNPMKHREAIAVATVARMNGNDVLALHNGKQQALPAAEAATVLRAIRQESPAEARPAIRQRPVVAGKTARLPAVRLEHSHWLEKERHDYATALDACVAATNETSGVILVVEDDAIPADRWQTMVLDAVTRLDREAPLAGSKGTAPAWLMLKLFQSVLWEGYGSHNWPELVTLGTAAAAVYAGLLLALSGPSGGECAAATRAVRSSPAHRPHGQRSRSAHSPKSSWKDETDTPAASKAARQQVRHRLSLLLVAAATGAWSVPAAALLAGRQHVAQLAETAPGIKPFWPQFSTVANAYPAQTAALLTAALRSPHEWGQELSRTAPADPTAATEVARMRGAGPSKHTPVDTLILRFALAVQMLGWERLACLLHTRDGGATGHARRSLLEACPPEPAAPADAPLPYLLVPNPFEHHGQLSTSPLKRSPLKFIHTSAMAAPITPVDPDAPV